MRFKTAVIMLLLVCAACATTGKKMPTVENNVVSLRGYRDVTIANTYDYVESDEHSATAHGRDTLTASTSKKYLIVRFREQKTDMNPNLISLTYTSLPTRWRFAQVDDYFLVKIGNYDFRAMSFNTSVDDKPMYMIRLYYYPRDNLCQMLSFYVPKENIPSDRNSASERREYVVGQLQEAIVAF